MEALQKAEAETGIYHIYLTENRMQEKNAAGFSHRLLQTAVGLYRKKSFPSLPLPEKNGEETALRLGAGKYGKPCFEEYPGIHFSISHSGPFWCCAFGDAPVGLDIQAHALGKATLSEDTGDADGTERLRQRMRRISGRFFHPSERAWLDNGGDFFAIWTAKESYVKFTGEGMHRSFESFAVADENGLLPFVKAEEDGPRAQLRLLDAPCGYSLCLCAEQIGDAALLYF